MHFLQPRGQEMKRLIVTVFGMLILITAFDAPAQSRPLHHRHHASNVRSDAGCNFTNEGRVVCGGAAAATNTRVVATTRRGVVYTVDEGTIIGSRPSDCPHAYCGC